MNKVVILTALPVERKAVRAHLSDIRYIKDQNGTIYDYGHFICPEGTWEILLAQTSKMGITGAALLANEAINFFTPDLLFMVGIAGGIKPKSIKPGDVVASDKVYQYMSGKDGLKFLPRPKLGNASYSLIQLAEHVIDNEEWQTRIKGPFTPQSASASALPIAQLGALAAGEQVVSSTQSPIVTLLQQNYNDTLAIEMEGYGVLDAASLNPRISAIVIRGISDMLDDKDQLGDAFQEVAARHASAFAFEMLAQFSKLEPISTFQTKIQDIPLTPVSSTPQPNLSQPDTHTAIPLQPSPQTFQVSEQSTPPAPRPVRIFYSFAQNEKIDKGLIDSLKKNLTFLQRNGIIEEWDTSHIIPGTDIKEAVNAHLYSDDIFVLGLSYDYVGSLEYDYFAEMKTIMEQRSTRKAIVIPILLRRTAYLDKLPIKDIVVYPRNRQTVNENKEDALEEIANVIQSAVEHCQQRNC